MTFETLEEKIALDRVKSVKQAIGAWIRSGDGGEKTICRTVWLTSAEEQLELAIGLVEQHINAEQVKMNKFANDICQERESGK